MSFFDCNCRNNCTVLALVLSLVTGVVAAFLQITAVITLTPVFFIVAFAIATGFLALALIASPFITRSGKSFCICTNLSVLLSGIFGTILTSIILLLVTFAATSVIGAIILGALAGFFTLTLLTVACLIKCILSCSDED